MNDPTIDEKAIFNAARQIADEAARERFISVSCGGDSHAARRIHDLLRAGGESASFLESPAHVSVVTSREKPVETVGSMIGPYKLLQEIGEGGMGTVYLAEQTRPVHRKVALKVIKAGMDSREIIARFEAERQALALMDHVNIARVLDAGTTESGRPYFVMEVVHGMPITRYCDENRLTPRERLELFVPVCQAIQHAHQKGIIHRDIKPSNVMVTLYDGRPVPKVIDFGVAKATEQKLTEKTLFTQYGSMVGTLEYMSPEQAELSALGVDTRSDIYSLGVLLYELLTGTTPLGRQRIREAGYFEILRMIKEVEPAKPSTRLSDSGEQLASISAQRHMDPARLTKLVKGELDWIVMKSLEKDRNRRYETANGFAAEILRYLNDEPVLACPPSRWYRVSKFARKNRKLLATLATLAALLVVATVSAIVAAVQSDRLAQKANELTHAAEERANAEAKARAELDRRLYANRIALAQQELYAQNIGRAEELLEECPPDLRGWEWHFLKRFRPGNPLTLPKDHRASVFSPDGRFAAEAYRTAVYIMDPKSGDLIRMIPGLASYSDHYGVAFCKQGNEAIVAVGDCLATVVRIWDASTGQELKVLEGHGQRLRTVEFSPDGRLLAAGSISQGARVWDWRSGTVQFEMPEMSISRFSYSPDGAYLAVASFGTEDDIHLYDTATGRELHSFKSGHQGGIEGLSYCPDAEHLASSGDDGTLKIWRAANGELVRTLRGHVGAVKDLAYAPDGRRLASAGWDKTVKIWDPETGHELLTLRAHTEIVMKLSFSMNGELLLTNGADLPRIWNGTPVRKGEERAALDVAGHTDVVRRVAYSPDGKHLATVGADRLIQRWDVESLHPGRHPQAVTHRGDSATDVSVAFSPDSRRLVSAGWRGPIRGWATDSDQSVLTVALQRGPPGNDVRALDFSPDGSHLATLGPGGLAIRDAMTGEPVRTLAIPSGDLFAVEYHPNGKQLALCQHSWVKLVDVETLKEVQALQHHTLVPFATYNSDGTRLASAGFDNTIRIYDASNGNVVRKLLGHTDRVVSVAFSPDDKLLASGGGDSTVRIWNAASGQELITLRGHTGYVWGVAFSPDGQQLTSVGGHYGKGEVRVWDLATVLPAANQPQVVERNRRQEIELNELLATAQPRVWQHRRNLGRAWAAHGQWDRAIDEYANAIQLNPALFHELAGSLQAQDRNSEVEQIARRLVSTLAESGTESSTDWTLREILAHYFSVVGWTHLHAGRSEESRTAFQQSLELHNQLVAEFPGRRDIALLLANNHNDLATALTNLNRRDEAERLYLQALAMKEKLVTESPENSAYRFHLAHANLGLGYLNSDLGQPEKAATFFSEAAAQFEKVAAGAIDHRNRLDAGHALWNLSDMHFRAGKQDEAEAALQRALDTFVQAVKDFPAQPLLRMETGFSHWKLGELFRHTGRSVDAVPHYRETLQIYRALANDFPQDPEYRRRTIRSYRQLIEILRAVNKETEAAEVKAALERDYPEE